MVNLTREEKSVLLFLLGIGILGTGVDFLIKTKPAAAKIYSGFKDISKINLNTSDSYLLEKIPGIGHTLAKRIIQRRQEEGAFHDLDELKEIKGITKNRIENMRDYILIE